MNFSQVKMSKMEKLYYVSQHIHKRNFIMNRRSMNSSSESFGMDCGGNSQRSPVFISAELTGNIAYKEADEVRNKRQGEKKLMQNLNDRLAVYISRVRTLETENKALRESLKKKEKVFNLEPMKEKYQAEIDETKKRFQAANKENTELKVQVVSIEDQLLSQRSVCHHQDERIDQLQDKVNNLNDENANRSAECDMLRRKVEELEMQVAHWKAKYNEDYTQLQTTRTNLVNEINQRILEYSRAEALQEELDFLKNINDAEIKEYKAMLSKEDETGFNVRYTWNDEFSKCMKELREEYEQKLVDIYQELSSRYESQLLEIKQNVIKIESSSVVHSKEEIRKYQGELSQKDMRIKELEDQVERMKLELKSLRDQLQTETEELRIEKEERSSDTTKLQEKINKMILEFTDAKLSLELEIIAYKKLLESEENRFAKVSQAKGEENNSGSRVEASQVIESDSISSTKIKITMKRSSKGFLTIGEVDNNGRFVTLQNTSTLQSESKVNLKGWKLIRKLLATKSVEEVTHEFIFPNEHVLGAGQNLKIWAKNFEKENDFMKCDIFTNIENWGDMNRSSELELIDDKGVVKATLSIKATF